MIKIYYKTTGCSTLKSVRNWLDKRNLPYQLEKTANITRPELIQMLSLSTKGFEELLVQRTEHSKLIQRQLAQCSTSTMIDYCLKVTSSYENRLP